ncbi:MAG: ATP-binding protein [Sulfuricurvum sp.]
MYEAARDSFLDTVDVNGYVNIDRASMLFDALLGSVAKPLKMVLLYGKPGTGKSMLLAKLHAKLLQTQKALIYATPILDENEFYKLLAQDLYGIEYDGELNFTQFIKIVRSKDLGDEPTPIVMLDEAQLYSPTAMEKIRLLSDTRNIKFVISLHKTAEEDLIAKEHFQTRIWESFEMQNASMEEISIYVQKKLIQNNLLDVVTMFNPSTIKLIHRLTDGNYRNTNKLLFCLFEICHLYEQTLPKRAFKGKIPLKMVEMAALHTGFLND